MLPLFRFISSAIELDPNFALAYAWLGLAFNDIGELSHGCRVYPKGLRTARPNK